MEIGLNVEGIEDKEAGDIIEQIVSDLKEQGFNVTDYWIEVK